MPSPKKELLFFDYNWEDEDYLKQQYAHHRSGQIIGEFSPSYFVGEHVPERIYERDPKVKLIVCLREPVERAYSHYCMHYKAGTVSPIIENEIVPGKRPYDDSGYRKNLERFLGYFPREQFHILKQEDMQQDPQTTLSALLLFLGVDVQFTNPYAEKNIHTRGKAIRHQKLYYALSTIAKFGRRNETTSKLLNKLYLGGVGRLYKKLDGGEEFPPLTDELRESLKKQFAPDRVFLKDRFGLETHEWE